MTAPMDSPRSTPPLQTKRSPSRLWTRRSSLMLTTALIGFCDLPRSEQRALIETECAAWVDWTHYRCET